MAVLAVAVLGVAAYSGSPAHRLHDSVHALQQFDQFYLNETTPFCRAVGAGSRFTAAAAAVARAYGLLTTAGRVGPGYAVVDAAGQLRYRTFDPAPAAHVEVAIR